MLFCRLIATTILTAFFVVSLSAQEKLNVPPPGYVALFNGKDLIGWRGIPCRPNPNKKNADGVAPLTMPQRLNASPGELAAAQELGDKVAREHWSVENGVLVFDGKGQSLVTDRDYADFELYVDWKIKEKGDSGIYLRGTPQIQIWDPFTSPNIATGEQWGSGGVFNNKINPKEPLVRTDKPIGEWNTFWIKIIGDKVTVKLNGPTVADFVTMENYWERDKPLYPKGTIELQNHGNTLYFRNIYIKELP
jgi:hypothetical protein